MRKKEQVDPALPRPAVVRQGQPNPIGQQLSAAQFLDKVAPIKVARTLAWLRPVRPPTGEHLLSGAQAGAGPTDRTPSHRPGPSSPGRQRPWPARAVATGSRPGAHRRVVVIYGVDTYLFIIGSKTSGGRVILDGSGSRA